MPEALFPLAAVLVSACGMGWFALSLKAHWRQVCASELPARRVPLLRALGSLGVSAGLLLCLLADAPTMAVLVWVMSVTLSGFLVGFTLSWRPALLRPLVLLR